MDDPILLTIIFKGVAMLLAIVGGVIVARYGFHLFKDGAGHGREHIAVEVGSLKVKAQSVGSVVMATAFLWVWAGVWLSPNLDKNGVRVYSFKTPEMKLESLAVSIPVNPYSQNFKMNSDELKKLLQSALTNKVAMKGDGLVELNGRPAVFDLSSIRTLKSESGGYLVTTEVTAGEARATVAYKPKLKGRKVLFVPAGIGTPANDSQSPHK